GDLIKIGGGIRKASKTHGRTINVEFIEVIKLVKNAVLANPMCTRCEKRMKSKGKEQGFKCEKCGNISEDKVTENIPRKIKEQLYLPVASAHRHLTRPMQRLNKSNRTIKFDDRKQWFSD
ncbi:MAG: DNA-binding protein, partial [Patescibacteria group bacterium]|nr:DNA-binding protein [Patescibacteria group bacterium]